MRLVILITDTAVGGAERQAVRLACELSRKGAQVSLLSMMPRDSMAVGLEDVGVQFSSLGLRRGQATVGAFLRTVGILKRWNPDVLLSFLYHANMLGRLVRPFSEAKVVVSSVRTEYFGGRLREVTMRATDCLSDATVTNSHAVAESLVRRGIVPRRKVRVVPNAVSLVDRRWAFSLRRKARSEMGVDEAFVWLSVGRVEPRKGHAALMEATRLLPAHDKPRVLLVLGLVDEEKAAELGRLSGESTRVVFAGQCRDVDPYFAAADGFIHPSRNESMPNAVLEAMAHGVPVVATSVGGLAEVVSDGVNGFLVQPGDTASLAAAMLRIELMSPAERAAMGEYSRLMIARQFTTTVVVDAWGKLFEELLRQRRQRG